MYLEHFGLQQFPFSIAPDPDFLFPAQAHQEALAHLHYAYSGHGGLICLTGEVGTGKTTVCRAFMEGAPESVRFAYLFNPQLSPQELLQSICDELRIDYDPQASLKDLYAVLNKALLDMYADGQRVICVIDEAQSMPAPLLEQVRLLTNLETSKEKLLTLILVGQPELNGLLQRYDLRQLNQRITARFHIRHLSRDEIAAYLQHRTRCAGAIDSLFTSQAITELYRASQGIPRLLNSLADRSLLGAFASGVAQVNRNIVRTAAKEVGVVGIKKSALQQAATSWRLPVALSVLLLSVGIVLVAMVSTDTSRLKHWQPLASILQTPEHPAAVLAKKQGLPARDCPSLERLGWQCLWVDWPLNELKNIQHNVLVKTVSDDTQDHWQLLTQDISSTVYLNQALIIWQPPKGYSKLIRLGQKSPVISWVRQQLGMSWGDDWQVIGNGRTTAKAAEYYDVLLAKHVADFQREHDLKADQIIGPKTLLLMQTSPQPKGNN